MHRCVYLHRYALAETLFDAGYPVMSSMTSSLGSSLSLSSSLALFPTSIDHALSPNNTSLTQPMAMPPTTCHRRRC